MFRRIPWEDSLQDLQTAGLFLLAVALALLVARVWLAPEAETSRLAGLPLSDDQPDLKP
jgi:hypothetical protein